MIFVVAFLACVIPSVLFFFWLRSRRKAEPGFAPTLLRCKPRCGYEKSPGNLKKTNRCGNMPKTSAISFRRMPMY